MKRLSLFVLIGALPLAASAQQVVFSDNFDADHTSAWQFNSSVAGDTAGNNSNNEANFFFDYSTVGIPQAPNSIGTTRRGLKMEANVYGTPLTPTGTNNALVGVFSGMSASPLGKSFTGDYTLKFDAWQNFIGPFPNGGSGSTQMTLGGIGSATNTAQFPGGTFNGVGFAASNDGAGTATDFRAYTGPGAATGTYAAGSQNNTNAYYSSFQGAAPAAQTALFASQAGTVQAGALGMAWHQWAIQKIGTTVTWSVDGKLIATATNVNPAGSNIFLGQFDINATVSTDANSRLLTFGLVDNVAVTQAVPEPATMAALGLGVAAMLRRRKKA